MKVSTRNDAFFKSIDIVYRESKLDIDMFHDINTDSAYPYRTTPWYHAVTFVYSNRNLTPVPTWPRWRQVAVAVPIL